MKKTKSEAGAEGGLARSEPKRRSSKANASKAREMKLLYRLDPSLRLNPVLRQYPPKLGLKFPDLDSEKE